MRVCVQVCVCVYLTALLALGTEWATEIVSAFKHHPALAVSPLGRLALSRD